MMNDVYRLFKNIEMCTVLNVVIIQQIDFQSFSQIDASHQSLLIRTYIHAMFVKENQSKKILLYYPNFWTVSGAVIVMNVYSVTLM